MTPAEIRAIVGATPHTSHAQGEELYEFIRKHRLTRCLELGFQHGVGTIWLAGALRSLGGGEVIAVDLKNKPTPVPSAPELVNRAGVADIVELHDDPISYTWHLKRNLTRYVQQPFDFVFIDGAHTWDTDGFAFFLVEQILRPGGWILFDDLNWSFDDPAMKNLPSVRSMTEEARTTPQIRAVWDLLVLQHPHFGNFIERGNWGWAQKVSHDAPRRLEIRSTTASMPERLLRRIRRLF